MFSGVPLTIVVLVQKYLPVGQADFIVCIAQHVIDAVGIAGAVAVHVTEFHATDLAHDDGRGRQLNGCGATAADVYRGLQGAACPGVGAIGQAFALVGYIAGGGNQQAILDFGTARCGVGARVDKSDGDDRIFGTACAAGVGHVADACDVGVDSVKRPLHTATVGEGAVGLRSAACKTARAAVSVGRCHVDKAARVGVALVVVVGDVERVGLPVRQGCVVAGFVEIGVRHHLAFKVV